MRNVLLTSLIHNNTALKGLQACANKHTRREVTTMLIGGGVYIHIFMFFPTSFFQIKFKLINLKRNSCYLFSKVSIRL